VVDKYDKYSYLFKGFRKNKFVINSLISISKLSDVELSESNLFFIVLYEPKDIFELLKIYKGATPIIIASENVKILKKIKNVGCFIILDLSKKGNLSIGLHECIEQVL
jgi:hypothetical protein